MSFPALTFTNLTTLYGTQQSRWSVPVTEADLFDMSFIRFPSAERRLVRTVAISKHMTLNAGYSAELDTTVAEVSACVVWLHVVIKCGDVVWCTFGGPPYLYSKEL